MAYTTKNMQVTAGNANASVTAQVTDSMPEVPCPGPAGYMYKGLRYVPVFADPIEWNSANSYEALTIVVHEGNSYTSKQSVPVGIDISNETFWALTGNYNAQVEQYRQETARVKEQADKNSANIAINTTKIENIINDVNEINAPEYMIIIGDSFSTDGQSGSPLWYTYVAKQWNLIAHSEAVGGTGYINTAQPNFLAQVNNAKTNLPANSKVAKVIVFGGLNDLGSIFDVITFRKAAANVIKACKTNWPNAEVIIAGCNSFPNMNKNNYNATKQLLNACISEGATFYQVGSIFNFFTGFFGGKDGTNTHPSITGERAIAQFILNNGTLPYSSINTANLFAEQTRPKIVRGSYSYTFEQFTINKIGNGWDIRMVLPISESSNLLTESGNGILTLPAEIPICDTASVPSTLYIGNCLQLSQDSSKWINIPLFTTNGINLGCSFNGIDTTAVNRPIEFAIKTMVI